MTASMWMVLTALLFLAVAVAALVEQVRYDRRTGPKCPCGCGRTPGQHNEPATPIRFPRQRRPL